MSEYWTRLAVVYFSERARATRTGGSGAPTPTPAPDELDEKGRWFLTG